MIICVIMKKNIGTYAYLSPISISINSNPITHLSHSISLTTNSFFRPIKALVLSRPTLP